MARQECNAEEQDNQERAHDHQCPGRVFAFGFAEGCDAVGYRFDTSQRGGPAGEGAHDQKESEWCRGFGDEFYTRDNPKCSVGPPIEPHRYG